MTIEISAIHDDFVARVSGVDLKNPLQGDELAAIVAAADKYAVLIFPGQLLSQDEQVAFVSQLGPLDTALQQKVLQKLQKRIVNSAISDISNIDENGRPAGRSSKLAEMNISNQFWHTDSSYDRHPFRYSVLVSVKVPEWGGETEFADLRAAYDALDARTKDFIKDRWATFYAWNNRQWLGIEDSPETLATFPPVEWPLVRTHAGSGRKVLWCDTKVTAISDMPIYEARALAHDLIEHATQREFVYRHHWTPGDVVLWDNRSVLHRGRPFDMNMPREMRRVSTVDDTESRPAACTDHSSEPVAV